jgi:SAM-dependent MidA family methyltransferase
VQFEAKSKRQTVMANDKGDLASFISDTIRERGPVTFRWFMEQALYHPEHGFYSSGRCIIGRRGDYFTNVSVGSLFGRLMAVQFAEIWELLGRPNEFTIVEQGAHEGDFARDVLKEAREKSSEFFDALRYRIIEPFPILQNRQEAKLERFREKMNWQKSLEQMEKFAGVHFSNELIDAMPVHLIASAKDGWQEKYVSFTAEHFDFAVGSLSTSGLRKQLAKLPAPPGLNYETEVNLAALDWIEMLSAKLDRGFALAVDYGYVREEFFAPERTTGTLQSFANHRVVSSPLLDPGQIDITAHVDWTSLSERAEECGLEVAGFTDQHHFLTALATTLLPNELAERDRRALQTLLHPGLLGRTFQFLALSKNLSSASQLTGFKFARNPRPTLGLNLR